MASTFLRRLLTQVVPASSALLSSSSSGTVVAWTAFSVPSSSFVGVVPSIKKQRHYGGISAYSLTRRLSATTTASTSGMEQEDPMLIQAGGQPELPTLPLNAKRLFLVRHGEVINPGGLDRPVYYGSMDVSLSSLGQQEAVVAAKYLSQFKLSRVFSSPLSRAKYGAEKVVELQQQKQKDDDNDTRPSPPLKVTVFDGFKELDRGDWCGKTSKEIGLDNLEKFDACDESVTPTNGESFRELKSRVMETLQQHALKQMEVNEVAALVSHLQVTRCIVSDALNIPIEQVTTVQIATASISCIDYEYGDDTMDGDDSTNHDVRPTVHFQSYKPDAGLPKAKDMAN